MSFNAKVDWTAPTAFTNGDPIDPANDLLGYEIEYYSGAGAPQTEVINGGTVLTHTFNNLPDLTLAVRVRAQGSDGAFGSWKGWVLTLAPVDLIPGQPGEVTVTIV